MANVPANLKYTEEHEWVLLENGVVTVGVTDHAQGEMGDVTFVELPEVDSEVSVGDPLGVIESVKAASDLYSPVEGVVVEINEALEDAPETVNADAFTAGWIAKIKIADESALDNLMTAEAYTAHIS